MKHIRATRCRKPNKKSHKIASKPHKTQKKMFVLTDQQDFLIWARSLSVLAYVEFWVESTHLRRDGLWLQRTTHNKLSLWQTNVTRHGLLPPFKNGSWEILVYNTSSPTFSKAIKYVATDQNEHYYLSQGYAFASGCYPHIPIDMLGIYRFLCLFVRKNFVTDIFGVGWRRAMKFGRIVDLGG